MMEEPDNSSPSESFKAAQAGYGRLKSFSEALVPIADFVGGFIAQPVVFFLVLLGIIEATGAPPGGVLGGQAGAVIAFASQAFWGLLAATFQVIGWLDGFLLLFGLIGSIRWRSPWYAVPLALVVAIIAAALNSMWESLSAWLGSVTRADAAAFWGAFIGSYISMMGRLPLWAREIWLWSNSGQAQSTGLNYWERLKLLHTTLVEGAGKNAVSLIDMAFMFGVLYVGWTLNGWLGAIIAAVFIMMVWAIARGILMFATGLIVAIFMVLPLAATLAIWEPYVDESTLGGDFAPA